MLWPISETRFSDKPVYTMACSTEVDGSGEFEMEIWRVRN
jgi:hypothetical protein